MGHMLTAILEEVALYPTSTFVTMTLFDSVVVGQYSTNPKEQELIGLSQRMKLSTDEALKLSVFCCCWPSSGY